MRYWCGSINFLERQKGNDLIIELDRQPLVGGSGYFIKTGGAITDYNKISSFKDEDLYKMSMAQFVGMKEIGLDEFKVELVKEVYKVWTKVALEDIEFQGIIIDENSRAYKSRDLYNKVFSINIERFMNGIYKSILESIGA